MPYGAFSLTVTGALWLLSVDVGLADAELDVEDVEDDEAEVMPAGTAVASAPSRTFT